MTKDFSNIFDGKKQSVKGRSYTHKLGNAGFLAKTVGVAIIGVTMLVFSGTMIMGWLIKSGLSDLAQRQTVNQDLVRAKQKLIMERQELLSSDNLKIAASELGLYLSPGQVKKL